VSKNPPAKPNSVPTRRSGGSTKVSQPHLKNYSKGHGQDSHIAKEEFCLEASEIDDVLKFVAKIKGANAKSYPDGGKRYGELLSHTAIHIDKLGSNNKNIKFTMNILIQLKDNIVKEIIFEAENFQPQSFYNIGDAIDSLARTLSDN